MWYICKQWWNWVWRQWWYRLLELEEDTYAETRSGTEGHIWWKRWPWPQVSWRPGAGHWTVHTPAETAEKCSGSPGSWEWNATDVLDALECSGMHKRSDLMGQSPFGFIGMNWIIFVLWASHQGDLSVFAGLCIALMLITVHLSGWWWKRWGPTCARFRVHLLWGMGTDGVYFLISV